MTKPQEGQDDEHSHDHRHLEPYRPGAARRGEIGRQLLVWTFAISTRYMTRFSPGWANG